MKFQIPKVVLLGLIFTLNMVACQTQDTPPTVDIAGTLAVQFASTMMAQTVAAYSPTPPPSPTSPPVTDTPIFTATPAEPTKDPTLRIIRIKGLDDPPACRRGPDESYALISNINTPKDVELLGIGNVPGWYVIKNPYFGAPCWLPETILEIDPALDLSLFPVMAPGQ